MRKRSVGFLLVALGLAVSICACNWTTQTGELREETEIVELDGAESATVNVRMGAGGLTLSGGADALAKADFTYNVAAWQPVLDYVVAGEEGELWIEQPEVKNLGLASYRYTWDLALNEDVPLALDVAVGAGEADLDVSTLSLTGLNLKVGAGGVDLDLTGERERDVDVVIRGGLGEATILLPSDVGVKAEVTGGLGELTVTGLTKEESGYVNAAYGESEPTITLDIDGGVGGVTLQVAE